MGFANRMVRAENRTLHKAKTTFGRVDMNEAAEAHIFVGAVVHRAVVGEFLADSPVRQS